ncbi:Nudix (nucleoside diphosphate linked moiety X)-type motif 22 [Halocaridina rubra]|uniref:Nudix (Nucleoside diphosphate linked moiety X)-type motif 22 n=1 Tax=Halocaridina rubra TaxID=373956 RepID=A0AAN9ACR0_HALRR
MHHIIKSLGSFDILWPYMRESENSAYVQGEQASGAICRHDLAANFDPIIFSRETNQDIEKQINDIWSEKCTLNPRLYNGTKFRYNGGEVIGKKYVLNVGLTSYKDLCGTNLSKNFKKILELGRNKADNSQAFMSDPIGVGVLLITDDGYGVVTRRAAWTGEFPGLLDRPGGHPEPEGKLKPNFGQTDINEIVMEEIWTSAAQEAEDELGIDKSKLEDMRFLGISINNESGGRPSLEFFARLRMKSQEIRELYNLGKQTEADESTALHFVPRHTLKMMPFFLLEQAKLGSYSYYCTDIFINLISQVIVSHNMVTET